MPQISINALKGATFISTIDGQGGPIQMKRLCQCPEWGDLHFYQLWNSSEVFLQNCVNALNGAFISTYAKGKTETYQDIVSMP